MFELDQSVADTNGAHLPTQYGLQQPAPFYSGFPCHGSNLAKLSFYQVGQPAFGGTAAVPAVADNATQIRLYGCAPNKDGSEWLSSFICDIKITVGVVPGFAGKTVTDIDKFCDAIELMSGDTSVRIVTDTAGAVASITVDVEGASYITSVADSTGHTWAAGTKWNSLVSLF